MIKIDKLTIKIAFEDTDHGEEFIAEADLVVAETPNLLDLQTIVATLTTILTMNIQDQIKVRNKEISDWQ